MGFVIKKRDRIRIKSSGVNGNGFTFAKVNEMM